MRATGASGTHNFHERWQRPVLAIPRGPRELAWHLGVLFLVVLVIAAPLLRIFVPITLLLLWAFSAVTRRFPYPREMMGHALTAQMVAAAHFTGLDGPSGWHRAVFALLTDRLAAPDDPESAATVLLLFAIILLVGSMSMTVIALLVAFDRRRVSRDVVDERVWVRQQLVRRSLMLDQHRRDGAPEVW